LNTPVQQQPTQVKDSIATVKDRRSRFIKWLASTIWYPKLTKAQKQAVRNDLSEKFNYEFS